MNDEFADEFTNILILNTLLVNPARYNTLLSALKHSRSKEVINNPRDIIQYSKWFTQNIINIQEYLLQEVKKEPDEKRRKYKDFSSKQFIRIFKSIYDGLVYRKLKFDHPFLRYGAEHHSPLNSVKSETLVKTLNFLDKYSQNNEGYILVNDLSNFLRMGDFLKITNEGIQINEIKEDFSKVLNIDSFQGKEPNKQFKNKIIPAHDILNNRIIKTNDPSNTEIRIKDVNFTVKTYFPELSRLLNKLDTDYFAEIQIDDYLVIRGFNMLKVMDRAKTNNSEMLGFFTKNLEFPKLQGWNNNYILTVSNYFYFTFDGLGNFARNVMPLSNYPIKDEHILDLMLGRKVLVGWINIEAIKKHLERRGWEVELGDIDYIHRQYAQIEEERGKRVLKPFEMNPKDDLIKIKRPPFNTTISLSKIVQIFSEAKRVKSLLNECEKIYELAEEGVSEHYIVRNLEEANIYK